MGTRAQKSGALINVECPENKEGMPYYATGTQWSMIGTKLEKATFGGARLDKSGERRR